MKGGQSVLSSVALTEEKDWRKLLAVTCNCKKICLLFNNVIIQQLASTINQSL